MARDQAVIGWVATRPALPDLTRDLLIDVLIFWEPLAPLPAVTAEPDTGADVGEILRSVARRLSAHPFHPDDHQTQVVLADLHCLLGLAWYSLLDPHGARAGRRRWEQHRDGVVQLRVLETDTAVDLALADLRRERGEWHPALPLLARARASTFSPWRRGRAGPRSARSGPRSHNLL